MDARMQASGVARNQDNYRILVCGLLRQLKRHPAGKDFSMDAADGTGRYHTLAGGPRRGAIDAPVPPRTAAATAAAPTPSQAATAPIPQIPRRPDNLHTDSDSKKMTSPAGTQCAGIPQAADGGTSGGDAARKPPENRRAGNEV